MTTIDLSWNVAYGARCACDACDWKGPAGHVHTIHDPEQRLEPGAVVPVGECPKCGVLAYLDEPTDRIRNAAPDLLSVLQEMLPRFSDLRELGGFARDSELADRARAAIAKAEGRS